MVITYLLQLTISQPPKTINAECSMRIFFGTKMVEENLLNQMETIPSKYLLLALGNPQLGLLSSTCTKRPFNSIGDA
jgi:hypothetical protein